MKEYDFITKQQLSNSLHKSTNNICVILFYAGYNDTTVFSAYMFVASA